MSTCSSVWPLVCVEERLHKVQGVEVAAQLAADPHRMQPQQEEQTRSGDSNQSQPALLKLRLRVQIKGTRGRVWAHLQSS